MDDAEGCFGFFSLFVVGTIVLIFAVNYFNNRSCRIRAEKMGVAYEHSLIDGCFYKIDGRFVPSGNYRIVD